MAARAGNGWTAEKVVFASRCQVLLHSLEISTIFYLEKKWHLQREKNENLKQNLKLARTSNFVEVKVVCNKVSNCENICKFFEYVHCAL